MISSERSFFISSMVIIMVRIEMPTKFRLKFCSRQSFVRPPLNIGAICKLSIPTQEKENFTLVLFTLTSVSVSALASQV